MRKLLQFGNWVLTTSLLFLIASLGIVVLLAKTLSAVVESIIISYNLPIALVGVIIAAIILLPEGIAAIIAAKNNKLQTSLNLSLGSALASIGLTIPSVAVVCIINDMKVVLGLDIKSIILLGLSVFTVMLSLSSGRTNIVYGVVLLVDLIAFVFLKYILDMRKTIVTVHINVGTKAVIFIPTDSLHQPTFDFYDKSKSGEKHSLWRSSYG